MSTLSKNTKYIVIGRDAGASKLDKAWLLFFRILHCNFAVFKFHN